VDDQEGLYVVLVDDREMLIDSLFEGTLERSFGRAGTWAIAGTTGELDSGFRGYVVEARRGRVASSSAPRTGWRATRSASSCPPASSALPCPDAAWSPSAAPSAHPDPLPKPY
jgi:hypothetical protein